MNKVLLAATIITSVLITGCSNRVGDLTVLSTKSASNIQLADAKITRERAKGEDSKSIIIIIPTGNPSFKEAIDQAIESVPCGIALKDAEINTSWFYIPYIYGENTIEVEGNVMQDSACLAETK